MRWSDRRVKRDAVAWFACAAFGAVVWLAVSAASGRREAWDSSAYFTVAMPLVAVASFAMGYLIPQRSWRWGLAPVIGQFVAMLVTQGAGNLLPLGVIVFAILSVPSVVAARLGAGLGARRAP